ncbi:MAG TPA: XdhC family protein [Mucilaginibacter sp.]|jgi:xanthine/CO dehydrogenase XdhC/CoxF family maturation factor|nr:XdhC family protein [Mucilaginibacter sp.]
MKEIKAIISAYDKIDKNATRAALATVVRVEGSSYRRTGARMLVTDDGVWIGGISGGCLEGDALKRARLAIAQSESSLITYDTTEDDAYQIGVGLGCNGIIDVLFTPLQYQNKNNPVEILKSRIAANRQTHILITITGLEGVWANIRTGDVIPYDGPESITIFGDADAEKQLRGQIIQQIEINKSGPYQIEVAGGKKMSVFIEILLPEIHVVLMGHQYDIYPLARMIKEIGWRVTMVSNPLKINAKLTDTVDAIFSYEQLNEILIDQHTAVVLMSHDYKTDKRNLPRALQTDAFYVGMLGPRVRSEKIFKELSEEGKPIPDEQVDRIYAPAGLDIGAISPEEIALSMLAEIKAVFSKREGGFLKLRHAPIHERN